MWHFLCSIRKRGQVLQCNIDGMGAGGKFSWEWSDRRGSMQERYSGCCIAGLDPALDLALPNPQEDFEVAFLADHGRVDLASHFPRGFLTHARFEVLERLLACGRVFHNAVAG